MQSLTLPRLNIVEKFKMAAWSLGWQYLNYYLTYKGGVFSFRAQYIQTNE